MLLIPTQRHNNRVSASYCHNHNPRKTEKHCWRKYGNSVFCYIILLHSLVMRLRVCVQLWRKGDHQSGQSKAETFYQEPSQPTPVMLSLSVMGKVSFIFYVYLFIYFIITESLHKRCLTLFKDAVNDGIGYINKVSSSMALREQSTLWHFYIMSTVRLWHCLHIRTLKSVHQTQKRFYSSPCLSYKHNAVNSLYLPLKYSIVRQIMYEAPNPSELHSVISGPCKTVLQTGDVVMSGTLVSQ